MIRTSLYAISIFVAIQTMSILGQVAASYLANNQAVNEIKQRVGLDLNQLDLGTWNTPSVADDSDIINYISRVNGYLEQNEYPARVMGLGEISIFDKQGLSEFTENTRTYLSANEQTVSIAINFRPFSSDISLSYLAILISIAYFAVAKRKTNTTVDSILNIQDTNTDIESNEPVLIVDLRKKALYLNRNDDNVVTLSNKPFCFYAALLRHCLNDSAEPLIHQKPIPESLLNYANETFQRLMELGHTKRKQPDFSTNLDKTLSEIRAALDEVFKDHPAEKCHFYPPKAQGEGSRTKRHCYSLETLESKDINIRFD